MATDPITDLQQKIRALEAMDLDKLRARTELLGARVDVEDLAEALAAETDADHEVVLLVVRAAWMIRLENDTIGEDIPAAGVFKAQVESDVRRVLTALTAGADSTGDMVSDRCLQKALQLGRSGTKIIPVRQLLDRTRCMIDRSSGRPGHVVEST